MDIEIDVTEYPSGTVELNFSRWKNIRFAKEDAETVLKYFRHRYKTSRCMYINLYGPSFWRNKIYSELRRSSSYRGCSVRREELESIIATIENMVTPPSIDEIKKRLPKMAIDELIRYAMKVKVV